MVHIMFFKRPAQLTLALLFALLLCNLLDDSTAHAQSEPDPDSLGRRHCIGVSPLDDDDPDTPSVLDFNAPEFCGCTWGNVYYRGQVIHNFDVSLSFTGNITHGMTHVPTDTELIEPPFYNVTGASLGAVRNDMMTVSVAFSMTNEFDNFAIDRTFRAFPENGEQQISFALPEYGGWATSVSGDYGNAIAVAGDVVYAGGADGLTATNRITNEQTEPLMPWQSQRVGRIAVATDGVVWASSDATEIVNFNGESWLPIETSFTKTIRALYVDTAGTLWVGVGDSSSGLIAKYNGTGGGWETVQTFANAPVTALVQDANGQMWAGTWGDGVYHQQADGSWNNYTVVNGAEGDGLASRYVLSAAAGDDGVWFGTDPRGSSNNVALGGVSAFGLDGQVRAQFGLASGLPADADFESSPAPIQSIAIDNDGIPWLIAGDTLYWLHGVSGQWMAHTSALSASKVTLSEADILIASTEGVQKFDRSNRDIAGTEPVVTNLVAPNGTSFDYDTGLVVLQATAVDNDDSVDTPIVAWEWLSSIDGPLCTRAESCSIPANRLSAGEHDVTLRVQDDEGAWSNSKTITINITATDQPTFSLFLPTIQQ